MHKPWGFVFSPLIYNQIFLYYNNSLYILVTSEKQSSKPWVDEIQETNARKRPTFTVILKYQRKKTWGCSSVECLILKKSRFKIQWNRRYQLQYQMEQIFVTRSGQGILLLSL